MDRVMDRAEIVDPEPKVEVVIRSYRLQTEFSDRLLASRKGDAELL